MAASNHERIGKALELLNRGLQPFIEREMQAAHGEQWQAAALESFPRDHPQAKGRGAAAAPAGETPALPWDTQLLLAVLWNQWNVVFKKTLGRAERSLVSELREVRNQWAHQQSFSTADASRALDSMQRLLSAIAAPEAADLERQVQELLRVRYEEQARRESKRAAATPTEGTPAGGLKPWREVVTPHPDVASGRYQQAEFAADLHQVYLGEGTSEYRDPREFFQRTFVTDGLRHLLSTALRRLSGSGGDPVVELQTNFGGGKTHSLLALFHLFSGVPARELAGVEAVLEAAGVKEAPKAQPAVLVGTKISPAQPRTKPDGTTTRTLWGELAWQLLGREGYALVGEPDAAGISPGAETLQELFTCAQPCLILLDEWVAYVRQLYVHPDDADKGKKRNLPGGSFEANMTFAQALTEAARTSPNTLVVASLPASDIEIGGEGGREALARLRNVFGRMESAWRPASAEEGFEIVRRRLFQPIIDADLFRARDAVVQAFGKLYQSQKQEFPPECGEGEYQRRMQAAYPIHPELFDRLYSDWSSLDKFQRTRGVLRLMAAVIHALWERQDANLLILPGTIPIAEPRVNFELTRYLDDPWSPIIEKDVDGPHALPLRLDRDNPNLGRTSACRRVARTIYMGSAPTLYAATKGVEDRQVKLGCAQPGESVATFGDALRRLSDQATHLYVDGNRYWFSTQPTVTRLAQDRAAQVDPDAVQEAIKQAVRAEMNQRGEFERVHPFPGSSGDVPDEREARLVVLGPEYPHSARNEGSEARQQAAAILEHRGSSPRLYRNTLVFLAADRARLGDLEQAVRQHLAWRSIELERETLNLDAFQANQAATKCKQAEETIRQRVPETYQWLLVPYQEDPRGAMEWQEKRLQGQEKLAVRASRKLTNEELLMSAFAPTRLRLELDRIPLWQGDHVPLKLLADHFAQYLYLPRLTSPDVLLNAVRDGLGLLNWREDAFAYADAWDEKAQRYRGLRAGQLGTVVLDGECVLVKPTVAAQQLDTEVQESTRAQTTISGTAPADHSATVVPTATTESVAVPPKLRRFHGAIPLDTGRVGRDAGRIAEEVIQHLAGLVGAEVEVTLEIQARLPDGAPDHVVRTVTENCRTLKFKEHGFEEE